jgi:hypothetical protein
VPFTDRFQLLDLKRDEGARTFEAREIATGRPVLVHLFADRTAPLNRALLANFETLPEEERKRVIDRGEHEGGLYFVTDRLADYPGLREWLKAKNDERKKALNMAGAWEVKRMAPNPAVDSQLANLFQTAPHPVLEPSAVEAPAAPILTDTGEQTLQMPTPVDPAPPPAPVVQAVPGEFTRQFAPPQFVPSVMRPAPSAPPVPAPSANEPGEFTRQFAPPIQRPAPASAPSANEPGEFTRQFAPPVQRSAPSAPPVPAPSANEPGEFTRQFMPPPVMRPSPTPIAPAQQQGEFTAMFSVPKPAGQPSPPPQRPAPVPRAPVPAPPQSAGEFTQMLQAQRPAAPPPASNKDSGEFANYFQSPLAPRPQGSQPHMGSLTPPPTPPQPKGAGEFTQIFGRDALPSPPPSPVPAAPPAPPSSNATQVFAAPRPMPPAPVPAPGGASQMPGEYTQMFAKPAALTFGQAPVTQQGPRVLESVPKRRNKSRLPLLLAIGAAVLLIVAVVVYFMMRPHST